MKYLAIDSWACFHEQLFAGPIKLRWYITGPVGPLGSTNQNWLGARLLPIAISIYPVVCVHPSYLLKAQHHCLWPLASWPTRPGHPSPAIPHPLPPTHPLISQFGLSIGDDTA